MNFRDVLKADPGCAIAERHHHGEVMGHDIVHLPGDARPLRGGGQLALLVSLPLQASRTVTEFGQQHPPGPGVEAETEHGGRVLAEYHATIDELVSAIADGAFRATAPD